MSESYQIQVHTIYSSTQETATAHGGGGRLRAVGVLTLLVGVAWLYVTWYPAWKWIETKATIGEIVMLTSIAGDAGTPSGAQGLSVLTQIMTDEPQSTQETPAEVAPRVHGSLMATAAAWIVIATGVGLWLAMAGSANIAASASLRRLGRYVLPISIILAGLLVWYVWKKYEWYESILPAWVRPALIVLAIAMAGSTGAIVNRHGRGALRGGAYLIVGSAVFSVVGIWSAVHWGHMPAEQVDVSLYAKVFGVQSAYGWLLFFGTFRRR